MLWNWLIHQGWEEGLLVLWPKLAADTFLPLGQTDSWQPFGQLLRVTKLLTQMWCVLASKSRSCSITKRATRDNNESFTFRWCPDIPGQLGPRNFRDSKFLYFHGFYFSPSWMGLRLPLLHALLIQLICCFQWCGPVGSSVDYEMVRFSSN